MTSPEVAAMMFSFDRGNLALDFANAADWRASGEERDWIPDFGALVTWGKEAGVLSPEEAATLLEKGKARESASAGVLASGLALGRAIYDVVAAVALGETVPADGLQRLDEAIGRANEMRHLTADGNRVDWRWTDEPALDRMLWAVALAAGSLLTSPDIARVRVCNGDPCGWLFLDTSKNRSRRWCDMSSCGNRAKARRFYAKSKATPGS